MSHPISPEQAEADAAAVSSATYHFADLATHIAAVWTYRLMPVVDESIASAKNGWILRGDGSEFELRRIPHPSLNYEGATKLLELLKAAGASDEGEAWERVVRQFVGEQWFNELVEEGLTTRTWNQRIAEIAAHQVVLTGFVTLNNLTEWWLEALWRPLHVRSAKWANRDELTKPIARFLRATNLGSLGTAKLRHLLCSSSCRQRCQTLGRNMP